jgi:hypothetical protein
MVNGIVVVKISFDSFSEVTTFTSGSFLDKTTGSVINHKGIGH